MVGDSLIGYAHNFYRGKDIVRNIRSGIVFAWYKFWVGDTPGALTMLDSLAELPDIPDLDNGTDGASPCIARSLGISGKTACSVR